MVSSPGIYFLIMDLARAETVAYLEMADLVSGTSVKILSE